MNEIVILYNQYDEASRKFCENNSSIQTVSWYGPRTEVEQKTFEEYCSLELPHPSIFPCVVNTVHKFIVHSASDMAAATLEIEDKISKKATFIAAVREARDKIFSETKWIQQRHQDELLLGAGTTLTDAQYQEWLQYWKALRDITKNITDPNLVIWPQKPVSG